MNRFTFAGLMLFALLLVAPIASAQVGSPSCSGGSAYDLTGHGCVTGYTNGSAAAASIAAKVAGLAAPAQAVQQNQGWPGCTWGAAYDPMAHGFIAECFWQPAANAAASKPAGLAKPAPAENFDPCGFSEQLDLLLDPQALACLSQPFSAAKAASKPAGLAAPVPVAIPEQGWPGCPWGAAYDPMAHGYVPACFNRTADGAASPKTAGLAAPAPAVIQDQDGPGCAPGYYYYVVGPGDQGDCLPESVWTASATATAAASKPAGLAAPAPPQQQFGPCGFGGEWRDPLLDPLALACLR